MLHTKLTMSLGLILAGGVIPAGASPVALDAYTVNIAFETHPAYTNQCCSPQQKWVYAVPGWSWANPADKYNILWINPSPAAAISPSDDFLEMLGNGEVYQELNIPLVDNTDYSFSILVGRRKDAWSAPMPYEIAVMTAGISPVTLGSLTGNTSAIVPGTWRKETLFFNSGTGVAGLHPVVYLRSGPPSSAFAEVTWDSTPEPSTYVLMAAGLGLLGVLRRRRSS